MSDLFPKLAKQVDVIAFIYSMHSKTALHGPACFMMNTGFTLPGFPSMGSWVTYGLGSENEDLPAFVVLPDPSGLPPGGIINWGAGFLPAVHQATTLDSRADRQPIGDLFPAVKMDDYTMADGKRYGITEKFGYNTIGFNKSKVDVGDMQSLASMTDEKYKGRIAIYDYYLPVIGLAAMSIGKKTAELTEADLPAIKEVLLKMKANAKAVTDVVASQTALATGEVDILVGGGEWVTAGIAKENPDLDFSIPKEGAVLWSQSLAMFKDSQNKDMALKFIQYIMSPEGQARLATSSCYWGMPASTKAALDDEQKKILRFDEQPDFLKRAQGYPAPSEDLDKKMQDVWTEMIQAQ